MAQDLVLRHVPELFGGLCRSSQDDEAEVRALVKDCAALMGRFVEPAAQLAVLLPQVRRACRCAHVYVGRGHQEDAPRDVKVVPLLCHGVGQESLAASMPTSASPSKCVCELYQ